MTDEERPAPDSLSGKLRDLFGNDDDEVREDDAADDADEPATVVPKLPTDPPF